MNVEKINTECKHEMVKRTFSDNKGGYICVYCSKKFEEIPSGSNLLPELRD